jgi:hypothetical protein
MHTGEQYSREGKYPAWKLTATVKIYTILWDLRGYCRWTLGGWARTYSGDPGNSNMYCVHKVQEETSLSTVSECQTQSKPMDFFDQDCNVTTH